MERGTVAVFCTAKQRLFTRSAAGTLLRELLLTQFTPNQNLTSEIFVNLFDEVVVDVLADDRQVIQPSLRSRYSHGLAGHECSPAERKALARLVWCAVFDSVFEPKGRGQLQSRRPIDSIRLLSKRGR